VPFKTLNSNILGQKLSQVVQASNRTTLPYFSVVPYASPANSPANSSGSLPGSSPGSPDLSAGDNWRVAFDIVPVGFADSVPKRAQERFFSTWYGEITPGPRFSMLAMQNGQPVLLAQSRVIPAPKLTDIAQDGHHTPYDAEQYKRIATGEQTVESLFAYMKNSLEPLETGLDFYLSTETIADNIIENFTENFATQQCRSDRVELADWLENVRRKTFGFSLDAVEGAARYSSLVERYSGDYALPPSLIYAIMREESSFNPKARSVANALGLMQVVPKTAGGEVHAFLTGKHAIPTRAVLFTPEQNIRYGTAYLYLLHNRYFNEVSNHISRELCIIAAYNGGPGAVMRSFGRTREQAIAKINSLGPDKLYSTLVRSLPSRETRDYVVKVVDARNKFRHTGRSF
jgi:soluble lytic murein transglycosylase-like protein